MRVPARTAWAGAAVAVLVAACGGGGGGGQGATAQNSPSAPSDLPQAGPVVETPSGGTSASVPPGAQVVDIRAVSDAFDPAVVRVHPGAVHVTLHNADTEIHNLVVPAAEGARTDDVLGGETVSLDVTLATRASYEFFCNYHRLNGMQGVIVVE